MTIEKITAQPETGLFRIGYWKDRVRTNLSDLPEEQANAAGLAAYLRERYAARTSKFVDEFEITLKQIENIEPEDLVDEAALCLQQFFMENYSLEELEQAMRDPRSEAIESADHIKLNELIMVEFVKEGSVITSLKIHLLPVASKGAETVSELFNNGLEELAQKVITEDKFKNVLIVEGYSWLIAEYPRLATRCGFVVDAENPGHAFISKKDFISRYIVN